MDLTTINDETFARRRDRRVSFAETTAVHVFDRDDSSGASPKDDSHTTLSPCSDSGDNSSRDTREDEDGSEYDDEEMAVPPVRFTRDMTDSSPGSASVASVASNDDDNFFGPVSRSFMNSGGVSDSGVSEDNNNVTHDITLDSTAFSLHFRNIGGDDRSANSANSFLTTPTDNRTPFVMGATSELSGANDMVNRLKFSGSMSSAGLGKFSSIGNNSSKYDYARFSSTLSDLLRKVDDCMNPVSLVSHPTDLPMVQKGDGANLLTGELSNPTDASMDQHGDGAKPLTGEDPHPVDVSTDKNISIEKNGDGSKPIIEQDPHSIDVLIHSNGDGANPLLGEVYYPFDVSMDQNGDDAELLTVDTSCPVDTSMDQNGDSAMLLIGEIPRPSDVAVDQNADGAQLPPAEVSHPTDVSMGQNGDDAELITGDVSYPTDVSMDQIGDGAKPLNGENPNPVDVSTDKSGNGAKILTGEISDPNNVSIDKNGDGSKPVTGHDLHPIDVSIDSNGDGANPLPVEVSNPIDVSMDQNADKAELLKGETSCPIDTFIDQNGNSAMLLIGKIPRHSDISVDQNAGDAQLPPGEVSNPTDVPVDQNGDTAEHLTGEASLSIDAPMDQNGKTSTLLNWKVPRPIASMDQNGDASIFVNKEVSHVSMAQNGDGAKLVRGEVSDTIDAPIDKNVNCGENLILGRAFDDEPSNEDDAAHSKNMHNNSWSNTIPYSPKVNAASPPQNTISMQFGSAITLSSPLNTVQHPNSKPMLTPDMALANAQTPSNSKMAQLSETCQSADIMSELFKHSERISAIKESIIREFPKENITSTCLDFENENLPPSQYPDKNVVCNQEFDLEGRKRKLQQLLGCIEDRAAKHAKSLTHESQGHGEKPHNCNCDWRKLVENMSEISKISVSPYSQKLSIEELGSLSDMMEKWHRARKFDRLSDFLRNRDSTDQRQQRLAEAKSLHDKLLYKKANLELNRLKLNKLRSKAELVRQRAEECLNLKSKISDLRCSSLKEAYTFPTTSISVTQGEQDRLITKRKALKAMEQNVINLSASLRGLCKITEDISSDEIITIAREHLGLKNTHSIVQQDIKLWKLQDIVKEDKWPEIVLDYKFLFQRFRLGTGISGSILVNTTINKTKILQTFPNMNAYSAIEFVFGAKCTACHIDSLKLVRQETLETSLLLGNAVLMLHEVQAAKRELLNLTSANFNCKLSNTKMLELQLSFVNFKRVKKVVFSLDLSDLKFGMYPSESSELHVGIDRTMTTFDEVFLKEITALVQGLPAGRLMVLRLCRAVSQYVHSYCM